MGESRAESTEETWHNMHGHAYVNSAAGSGTAGTWTSTEHVSKHGYMRSHILLLRSAHFQGMRRCSPYREPIPMALKYMLKVCQPDVSLWFRSRVMNRRIFTTEKPYYVPR